MRGPMNKYKYAISYETLLMRVDVKQEGPTKRGFFV